MSNTNPPVIGIPVADRVDFPRPGMLPISSDGLTATVTGQNTVGSLLTCTLGGVAFQGTPTYQWYRNGSVISGATSSTYTPTQAGSFTCKVGGHVITSASFTVTP